MLVNSIDFIIFFPIVVAFYYLVPKKCRQLWLLTASYYFYMCWNAKYALLILTSTVVTYFSGIAIEHIKHSDYCECNKTKYKKIIVAFSLIINLGILFCFKYYNFTTRIISVASSFFNIQLNVPTFDVILPVGISFYTFQALGYTIDVYRDDIYAERNFIKYALFVSFFPQLVAGPIERSKNLLRQIANPDNKFTFINLQEGVLLMLWGFFLKIVLADRIAIFVDTVYSDYQQFPGTFLIVATILFAFQIYCDFAGYSIIAMGTARILGIQLMENFRSPYLSKTVSEFWRNWHISLTSWFKDYLYIPLGGSRKGTLRKYINKLIVFLVSGLWHGAQFTFVIWGGLNGLYQIVGEVLTPIRNRLIDVLKLNRNSLGHRIVNTFFTFIFVDFSWIFFRARSVAEAANIIKSILCDYNPWILFDDSLYSCGLDSKNFHLMLISILLLLAADFCKLKNIKIRAVVQRQDYWFRWLFIAASIAFILTFGIWGPGYNEAGFIYFQF